MTPGEAAPNASPAAASEPAPNASPAAAAEPAPSARSPAAAAERSPTASPVSQQLATLEREAGVALLDRHGGRVRLTEAGRRLVARTEAILAELEAASAELSAAAAEVTGDIHVAAFPSAERALLAPGIAALL